MRKPNINEMPNSGGSAFYGICVYEILVKEAFKQVTSLEIDDTSNPKLLLHFLTLL